MWTALLSLVWMCVCVGVNGFLQPMQLGKRTGACAMAACRAVAALGRGVWLRMCVRNVGALARLLRRKSKATDDKHYNSTYIIYRLYPDLSVCMLDIYR